MKFMSKIARWTDQQRKTSFVWTLWHVFFIAVVSARESRRTVDITYLYMWVHSKCIRCCKHKNDYLACSYKSHSCHSLHCRSDTRWYLGAQYRHLLNLTDQHRSYNYKVESNISHTFFLPTRYVDENTADGSSLLRRNQVSVVSHVPFWLWVLREWTERWCLVITSNAKLRF